MVALEFFGDIGSGTIFSTGSNSAATVVFGTRSWLSPCSRPNWCGTNQAREPESTSTRPKKTSTTSLEVAAREQPKLRADHG